MTLDLDVDDYDDETLAVLWAAAIRTNVLAARAGNRPGRDIPGPAAAAAALSGPADLVAVTRDWLRRDGDGVHVLPPVLLALVDPETAATAKARMPAAQWAALVTALARVLGLRAIPPPSSEHDLPSTPATDRDSTLATGRDRSEVDVSQSHRIEDPPDGMAGAARAGASGPAVSLEAAVMARLEAVAGIADDRSDHADLAGLTRAAGLVLVYPWLAEHCRRAEALHPHLDPLDVREAALAMVVDPDDPTIADDPLVGLLAGRSALTGQPIPPRMPLSAAREVAQSASGVLSSFAALLPGFERSSDAFVRVSWLVRIGRLDMERDPALLTAATHPLDVLLPLLPYPVGLIKLPLSPPLTVRFR
ncbi:hypothetical protein NIBR502772_11110 [Pseudarthrobacter sp. NIBRBAC000502772]|uniref:contractile injection system tape measure protein n=1 Tax=Pseudarthrobacter sp. NIBRBAC000502772 TaxID=2590775 RepID=UPI00113115BD|nr:contractile injection system tape measure protein [Pseudarthrobacter sp. NIBRBAC000502772]QDG66680.1 hypothetical protein NIBR502772_11110 [Pseudarthrobacter sp. NIBRBAC000502772]